VRTVLAEQHKRHSGRPLNSPRSAAAEHTLACAAASMASSIAAAYSVVTSSDGMVA
jgi:hypothetical protein